MSERGGEAQHGWLLWEWPSVLVEAEFHSVWRAPDGELVEVTGTAESDEEVLFLEDRSRRYVGKQVDNVRLAIRDDRLVHDLILLSERIYAVMNRGERATQHGLVSVPAEEVTLLLEHAAIAQQMIVKGLRATSPCGCGSARKYKRCHGAVISQ